MDNLLSNHIPFDDEEAADIKAVQMLIQNHPDCFWRNHFTPGHITGSGLLISADGTRVLLNHHKFLDMWIGFGGHADGETDILSVTRREIIEESGIEDIEPVPGNIADISVHPVPENPNKGEPAHKHFDIRYIFRVKNPANEDFEISDESVSLRWCNYDEAMTLVNKNDKITRLLTKWKNLI
jgi:8-oxo-dGTP pyrophosphatase MutT (NUDIX family)